MSFARMHNEHLDPDRHGEQEAPCQACGEWADDCICPHKWVTAYRRTEDPKLRYLESLLDAEGIPHRRNGESWHAPILEVPDNRLDAAWALLSQRIGRRRKTLDDMSDDDPLFGWAS